MPQERVLCLRLALMGRPVKTFTFGKPLINVGRDPDADVFIDNPGVSREHLRLEMSGDGDYEIVDLGSANGTLLNDLPVRMKIPLHTGDTIRLGKYTITVAYEQDRRETRAAFAPAGTQGENRTLVLSKDELNRLLERQHQTEVIPPTPPPVVARAMEDAAASSPAARSFAHRLAARVGVTAGISGFLLGAVAGAAVVKFVVH
jgi:predicted component of type VI protein secretion system